MFRAFPSESKRVGRGSSFPCFCLKYRVALTFDSVDEILKWVTIQMKAGEQFISVVLFIMNIDVQGGPGHWVAVDEIVRCAHLNESC